MPAYLEDEPPPVAEPDSRPSTAPRPGYDLTAGVPPTGRAWTYPPWFFRLVPLPGDDLPSRLETWWLRNCHDAIATVDGRFHIGPPRLERGVWTLSTRLHVSRLHNV